MKEYKLFLTAFLVSCVTAVDYYVSTHGSGTVCNGTSPCSLEYVFDNSLAAGNTIYLLPNATSEYVTSGALMWTTSRATVIGLGEDPWNEVVIDCAGNPGFWGDALTLKNLRIHACSETGAGGQLGGAAYYQATNNAGGALIENVLFDDHTSVGSGGAIRLLLGHGAGEQLFINATKFENCEATIEGGCVTIVYTDFLGTDYSQLMDVEFEGCTGGLTGGGLSAFGPTNPNNRARLSLTRVSFHDCHAVGVTGSGGGTGGGAYLKGVSGPVTDVTVTECSAAISAGGLFWVPAEDGATLEGNTLIQGNSALDGPAGGLETAELNVRWDTSSVTISDNSATEQPENVRARQTVPVDFPVDCGTCGAPSQCVDDLGCIGNSGSTTTDDDPNALRNALIVTTVVIGVLVVGVFCILQNKKNNAVFAAGEKVDRPLVNDSSSTPTGTSFDPVAPTQAENA